MSLADFDNTGLWEEMYLLAVESDPSFAEHDHQDMYAYILETLISPG